MTISIWLLTVLLLPVVFSQDKWVWSGRDSKAGFARADSKGRYGVYEPEVEEPFRPSSPNLPPLIRPSGRPSPPFQFSNTNNNNNNNRPFLSPTNNFNHVDNNRPYHPPDHFNNNYDINRRPYPSVGPPPPSFPGRPSVPINPAHPSGRPPYPTGPKGPEHPDNKDPTSFDKCKCVFSFNCKSPAILFGTCDAGKKYCCEKFVPSPPRQPIDDLRDPEVLVGPGGPVDHILKEQGNFRRPAEPFSRLPGPSHLS